MAEKKSKVFFHCGQLDEGGYPSECPFNTARAGMTRAKLLSMGMLSGADREERVPQKLSRDVLARFHTPAYLDALSAAGAGTITPEVALSAGLGSPDCPIFRGMYDYVALAAAGTVAGAELILAGEAEIAFNPSGGFHHAQPDHAAGFCYVSDIVLAIQVLAAAGRRVLFLDIDVHHGDGIQDAFYDRSDVMTISIHETGRVLFPGTGFETELGTGEGEGYCVNIPLPVGTYDAIYERAFDECVLPLIQAYDPDVIVLELGMDTLTGDPLAHLHLTNNTPADIVEKIVQLGKPLLATGGGGYHVENTVRGWTLCWSVMCGDHSDQMELMMGLGGALLENVDWLGGLRDRVLLSDAGRRDEVDKEVVRVLDFLKRTVFPRHGL